MAYQPQRYYKYYTIMDTYRLKGMKMKIAREVSDFPKRGNHIGDKIRLPSGQVYIWCEFKRWKRYYE